MKSLRIFGIALVVLAAIGLTDAFGACIERPFRGRGSGVAIDFVGGTFEGSGQATHLGSFTITKTFTDARFNRRMGKLITTFTGVVVVTAENGDELHGLFNLAIDFSTTPVMGGGIITWDDMGTGRFADASGGVVIITTQVDEFSLTFTAEGTICY